MWVEIFFLLSAKSNEDSFNKYLLSAGCVPGSVLIAGVTPVENTCPCPHGTYTLQEETEKESRCYLTAVI